MTSLERLLKGQSLTEADDTLENVDARRERMEEILVQRGFPEEQDYETMRDIKYVDIDSIEDGKEVHPKVPGSVNEAGELVGKRLDPDGKDVKDSNINGDGSSTKVTKTFMKYFMTKANGDDSEEAADPERYLQNFMAHTNMEFADVGALLEEWKNSDGAIPSLNELFDTFEADWDDNISQEEGRQQTEYDYGYGQGHPGTDRDAVRELMQTHIGQSEAGDHQASQYQQLMNLPDQTKALGPTKSGWDAGDIPDGIRTITEEGPKMGLGPDKKPNDIVTKAFAKHFMGFQKYTKVNPKDAKSRVDYGGHAPGQTQRTSHEGYLFTGDEAAEAEKNYTNNPEGRQGPAAGASRTPFSGTTGEQQHRAGQPGPVSDMFNPSHTPGGTRITGKNAIMPQGEGAARKGMSRSQSQTADIRASDMEKELTKAFMNHFMKAARYKTWKQKARSSKKADRKKAWETMKPKAGNLFEGSEKHDLWTKLNADFGKPAKPPKEESA